MAWRFEPGEDLRRAFGRVAEEEICKVRAGLAAGEADRARAIHEARQSFKRLRALARLARPALGGRFETENRRWRDAGRLLSGLRDRTVMTQSFEKAVAGSQLDLPASAMRWMRKRIAGGEAAPPTVDTEAKVGEVLGLLDAADKDAALDWPINGEVLVEGLRQCQARLRKSWKKARREGSPEALHEWRKRVKDQSAQIRLFRSVAPQALEDIRNDAKETAEHLGEEHDLWLLSECLVAEPAPPSVEKACQQLLATIKKRRVLLRRLAFEQGERFSTRDAESFATALGSTWAEAAGRTRRKSRRKKRPSSKPPAPTSQAG